MNLKRHHVLYALLALSLIIALIVFLVPGPGGVSFSGTVVPTTPSSAPERLTQASSSLPEMRFEVVTTQASQERGLGGRANIPQDYAMLFVFPEDERIGFWMKDMLAPIDMVWLSDNGTVLGIEDSVAADTYRSDTDAQIFYPPQPVKYVLETRAGEARRRGWKAGTHVRLPLPYGS